ncbi:MULTISPECIES: hypothetical protein [Cupriavidus]
MPTNGSTPAVAAAPPPQDQHLATIQTPQLPVRLRLDQFPQTLADAIAYVRMGEPTSNYSDVVTWHNICGQLRNQYKAHALSELHDLLKNISTGSIKETENAIDTALLDLRILAPVDWVLDRMHLKDLSDGSRSYRLIGHYAVINRNGAFAITDLNGVIWLNQTSASGAAFVSPT